MKLLLEKWRTILNEGEVVTLPTGATVNDKYASYIQNLEAALQDLRNIKEVFEKTGFADDEITNMINHIVLLIDDEQLQYDVENF